MAKGVDEDRKDLGPQPDESSEVTPTTEEPGQDAADDLTALLSRAALNQSQYREFSSQTKPSKHSQTDRQAAERRPEPAGKDSADAGKSKPAGALRGRPRAEAEGNSEAKGSAPEAASRTRNDEASEPRTSPSGLSSAETNTIRVRSQNINSRASRKDFDSSLESRWSILGRALSGETENSPSRLIQALANSLSLPFVFVSSVSGGTGVTTILATLARCLAAQGERILLVDAGALSLFPLYFGAAKPGAGELQNFLLHDSDGRVDTVNRKESDTSASLRQLGESESGGFVSTVRSAASGSDRLLLDARALRAGDAETLHPSKQFGLVPLVPDLSCVFGLLKFEEALRQRGVNPQESNAVCYLLNKFDGSLALHRDIKASLERQLGDRLLPITIRRSDAVPEALADGMTVIDYCPEAGVAEDFRRLADWLSERAPVARRVRND